MASTTTAASSTFFNKPASASWKPGDPVRFGTGSPYSATATSSSTTAQTTWSKSPWQPGMPVRLDREKPLPATFESLPLKAVANRGNGKQPAKRTVKAKKAEASSQSSLESYWPPSKKRSDKKATPPKPKSKNAPRSPIYIDDDSFDSGHATLGNKSASSTSTANATLGDRVNYDSSIELIQPKGSPLSTALRHFALGQQHLQEAIAQRNMQEQAARASTSDLSSSPLPEITSIFDKPRAPLPLSPILPPLLKTQARQMSTSSRSRNTVLNAKAAVDWDDPVLTADLGDLSDGSDLPDWPPPKPAKSSNTGSSSTVAATDKGKGKAAARQPFQAINPASAAQAKPASKTSAQRVDPKVLKDLRAESKAMKKVEKNKKAQAKAALSERLKAKYRQFSWDKEASVAPKVWYYKGKHAEYMGCDSKSSNVEPKTMEEVAASLKGPLGFDLEWSTALQWNPDFSRKDAQAITGLVQLGDQHNIILYQLSGSGHIPSCLLRIIEDPEIIKLGVQIKGDGSKLDRDFSSAEKPVTPRGCMELSDLAKYVDPHRYANHHHLISLQQLAADWLERYLEKGDERTSNWDAAALNALQRKYAANDVYCAVRLYHRIMGYAQELEGPVDFSHCIYDLHHKQADNGAWRSMGWKARGVHKRPPTSADSDPSRKQWDQASTATRRQLEAWEHWYLNDKERDEVAESMGIKPATIVGYIINALAADEALPFQHERLKTLTNGIYFRQEQNAVLASILSRPQASEEHEGEEEEEE